MTFFLFYQLLQNRVGCSYAFEPKIRIVDLKERAILDRQGFLFKAGEQNKMDVGIISPLSPTLFPP